MSGLSQFTGGARVPKVLINGTSGASQAIQSSGGQKVTLTGALTANTLATVLSVTGSGVINYIAASSVDATARTHRLKITIDGTIVNDSTSASVSTANSGISPIGFSSGAVVIWDAIPFNTSLLVEYASSVSETAKTNIYTTYRTN